MIALRQRKTRRGLKKSPEKTGVNRRNAVLFTRKKEAAKSEERPALKAEGKEEDDEKKGVDEQKQGGEFEFHEPELESPTAAELPSLMRRRGWTSRSKVESLSSMNLSWSLQLRRSCP